ncbi:MAG: hypothetical protein GF331_01695 [Chitinivibrionales bacterium]|nr:hypothetical protein [Chitinivibrionales bacterium]
MVSAWPFRLFIYLINGVIIINIIRTRGSGQRIPCEWWNQAYRSAQGNRNCRMGICAFKHHLIDTGLPADRRYAQVAVADLDNCGTPEYIVGQTRGDIFCYKMDAPDSWRRFTLGVESPSDVGGAALDVDRDGWVDFVAGGAWYRNSRDVTTPFERIVFDPDLCAVHDLFVADIDGDGRRDVVTMSDKNNLRWYRIPDDPAQPWERHDIGPAVHAGVAIGDIDGDGDLDIVRTDVWFENVRGDGTEWVTHPTGPSSEPPDDFRPRFAFNATRCVLRDMTGNGSLDIVLCDAEIPGGKIWWMENVAGDGSRWERHEIALPASPRRGAYHGMVVEDFDNDGDWDVFASEMEDVGGERPPRHYLWENVDGRGREWREHVILDENLGGHDPIAIRPNATTVPGIITKPWHAGPRNALGGGMFVMYLEPRPGSRVDTRIREDET